MPIANKIKSSDAGNFFCCVDPTIMCHGDKCMAWKTYLAPIGKVKEPFNITPHDLLYKETDLGYCGMISETDKIVKRR